MTSGTSGTLLVRDGIGSGKQVRSQRGSEVAKYASDGGVGEARSARAANCERWRAEGVIRVVRRRRNGGIPGRSKKGAADPSLPFPALSHLPDLPVTFLPTLPWTACLGAATWHVRTTPSVGGPLEPVCFLSPSLSPGGPVVTSVLPPPPLPRSLR